MERVLVSIETVKIKDFIFNTNKLRIIRGASYILDYLNQNIVNKILKEKQVIEEDILYVGAGNAKFFTSQDKAIQIIDEVKNMYKKYAPGAKIAGAYVAADKPVWDLLDELGRETAIQKSKGFPILNMDLPFIEKCSICNDNPTEWKIEDKDENKNDIFQELNTLYNNNKINSKQVLRALFDEESVKGLCRECISKLVASTYIKKETKQEKSKQVGFYSKVFNYKGLENFTLIEEVSELTKDNKSFVGFMYSDGDGLGDFLGNIKESFKTNNKEKEYIEFMKAFSKKLDEATNDSLLETLEGIDINDGKYGEFFIVGGDDVCGLFPADKVLKISTTFQNKFEEKMKAFREIYKDKVDPNQNITSSSGVIIAKEKTPMHYLFGLSLGLQKIS